MLHLVMQVLGNHGHYIMFYINEQDKAQLSMSGEDSGGSIADNLATPYNVPSFVIQYSTFVSRYIKNKKLANVL